jgi:hypothetical protein
MLHPILETSALNVNLVVTCKYILVTVFDHFLFPFFADYAFDIGLYALIIGFISLEVKQRWYLGEACTYLTYLFYQALPPRC